MLHGCPSSTIRLSTTRSQDAFRTTYDPDLAETFPGTDIDGRHLYPIGAGSWTWVIVDESGEETTADASADAVTKADEHALA